MPDRKSGDDEVQLLELLELLEEFVATLFLLFFISLILLTLNRIDTAVSLRVSGRIETIHRRWLLNVPSFQLRFNYLNNNQSRNFVA
jgi:hypothetical protein